MVTGNSSSKDVVIITVCNHYIFTIAVYIRVPNISDLPKV